MPLPDASIIMEFLNALGVVSGVIAQSGALGYFNTFLLGLTLRAAKNTEKQQKAQGARQDRMEQEIHEIKQNQQPATV